ncbi:mitochondrial carrier [Piedraia hortae CBS 480.64]|uniref:Mitochondrial carrier n=1 Tax=Piedraia hortae CBS 480.64 TaxID=1314780 RepID=A0A6A7C2L3_9PEZI|nr:mitochondrial carrier [Piedraia hortae CBS 480.64]
MFTPPKPLTQGRELGLIDPKTVQKDEDKTRRPWAHFVAGGMGGMAAATLTSPLDVLKTRLQSTFYQSQLAAQRAARGIPPPSQLPFGRAAWLHVRETCGILAQIPRVEGWRALFKGLGPNLVGVVPSRAIAFWAYGNGKKFISNTFYGGQESVPVFLLAGICAGMITGTATNPIWVVKTRLQLDKEQAGGRKYKNALDCIRKTVRMEGIRGLYRGLSASYLGTAESTLQWILYEQAKRMLARREARVLASGRPPTKWDETVSWGGKLGAAGAAKLVAALATYPHEVVRTRLRQAPVADGRPKYRGLLNCFVVVAREEGISALYGGLVPHILRVVPSAAIMFGVYEGMLRVLKESSNV